MNLQLNDPAVPAPGEMVNDERTGSINGLGTSSPRLPSGSPLLQARDNPQPHHHRAPSLGELHQELEAEQEAQVVGGMRSTSLAGGITSCSLTSAGYLEPIVAHDSATTTSASAVTSCPGPRRALRG